MNRKLFGVAAAGLLLSACEHAYPNLATYDLSKPVQLNEVLDEAAKLQKEYSDGYKETARWQDLGQLPIIGGAAAAAWVLLNDNSGAAKKAGKIGIVTTTYAATRGQLIASGMPDVYLAGYGALTCILAEGQNFHGTEAQANRLSLKTAIDALEAQIVEVNRLRYTPVVPKKEEVEALKAAYSVADQAVAGARTVEASSLKQLAAFDAAAPTFRNAVSAVSVAVASKGRVRPAVDFATLRDQMLPTSEGASERSATRNSGDLIQQLMAATNRLTTLTAKLSAGTPDYLKSLNTVKECPAQIH